MSDMTGGPAFPTHGFCSGMTLREWYAGQVLPSVHKEMMDYISENSCPDNWRQGIAEDAHRIADAMIAEGCK